MPKYDIIEFLVSFRIKELWKSNVFYYYLLPSLNLLICFISSWKPLQGYGNMTQTWNKSSDDDAFRRDVFTTSVLVSGPLSPKMFCYYIHLPANSLHLISLTLTILRTQVHHEVFYHCQRNSTHSFLLRKGENSTREEITILANYSEENW